MGRGNSGPAFRAGRPKGYRFRLARDEGGRPSQGRLLPLWPRGTGPCDPAGAAVIYANRIKADPIEKLAPNPMRSAVSPDWVTLRCRS